MGLKVINLAFTQRVIESVPSELNPCIWDRSQKMRKIYYMIYLTGIGLPPDGSSTVHIYTQTIRRTRQSTQTIHRTTQLTN
jgi:hypothetical protein